MSASAAIRFFDKVKITDGCWLWTAGTYGKPGQKYGSFWLNGKSVRAHRFSYEYFKGWLPEGKMVCHTCDNQLCVNPDHLYTGSAAQNNADRSARGRHRNGYTGKETCRKGHPWSKKNTMAHNNGKAMVKRCRECHNARRRK